MTQARRNSIRKRRKAAVGIGRSRGFSGDDGRCIGNRTRNECTVAGQRTAIDSDARRKSPTSVWRPFKSSTGKTPRLAKALELPVAAAAAVRWRAVMPAAVAGCAHAGGRWRMRSCRWSAAAAPHAGGRLRRCWCAVAPSAAAHAGGRCAVAVAAPLVAAAPAEAAALVSEHG